MSWECWCGVPEKMEWEAWGRRKNTRGYDERREALHQNAVKWQEWGEQQKGQWRWSSGCIENPSTPSETLDAKYQGSVGDMSELEIASQAYLQLPTLDWERWGWLRPPSSPTSCASTNFPTMIRSATQNCKYAWVEWGKRKAAVKRLPFEVWLAVVEFLWPRDLFSPRLTLRIIAMASDSVKYECSKCQMHVPWDNTVVCAWCSLLSCRDCAEPKEFRVYPPNSWSIHLCGEKMHRKHTCARCTRYCVACGRACCESCGWRGGRACGDSAKVRPSNEVACLPCVVTYCHFN